MTSRLIVGASSLGEIHMKAYITVALAVACALLSGGTVGAATTTYTSDTAYFAAAGPQSLQTFDNPISNTATSVTYPDLVLSCSGSTNCNGGPNFFGTSSTVSITGVSIVFITPSVITFTFDSPIHSFGIYIAGLGTVLPGSTTFSISNSNGFSANLYTNYSSSTTSFDTPLFGGLISDTRFTSVSLSGTEADDGIFVDNLYYGHAPDVSATPLPAALALFATGIGGLGLLGWRRKRKAQAVG
jgi:hypothetical protein